MTWTERTDASEQNERLRDIPYPGDDPSWPKGEPRTEDEPTGCRHCCHPNAEHGKYGCGFETSAGINCRCPIRGEA